MYIHVYVHMASAKMLDSSHAAPLPLEVFRSLVVEVFKPGKLLYKAFGDWGCPGMIGTKTASHIGSLLVVHR